MNLISIYGYLEDRFGFYTYKTGASLFLISRIFGSAIRLLLAATVFHNFIFANWGIPFWATVLFSIAFIWVCTFKGGIKTIVWTDTLQTLFMLLALGFALYLISDVLHFSEKGGLIKVISESKYSQIFFFDDPSSNNYFWKQFVAGMLITIGMTGLDQDLMQKNLSCKNIKEAQKNMVSFAVVLVLVNLVFLVLGAALFMYAAQHNINVKPDLLFPTIALDSGLPQILGVFFILGLFAATYASADSALASLTTSVCVDFIGVRKMEEQEQKKWKDRVHLGMSVVLLVVILLLNETVSTNAIDQILKFASFTYGPLIGLFAFGIFTKRKLKKDKLSIYATVIAILLTSALYLITNKTAEISQFLNLQQPLNLGFNIGAELILYNSLITFVTLYLFSEKNSETVLVA